MRGDMEITCVGVMRTDMTGIGHSDASAEYYRPNEAFIIPEPLLVFGAIMRPA
jgi:hypothetical protein